MTITVRTTTSATPDRVWTVLSDLRSWPDWLPTVQTLEPAAPDAPDGVGATYAVKQPRLPRARWTVTDWAMGRGFSWQSKSLGLTTIGSHELRGGSESRTEVELTIAWRGPLAWLARLAYGPMTRRYVQSEAKALVARAEQVPAR